MQQITRIILAGPGAVGKTTFLKRFIEGKYYPHMDFTVGCDEKTFELRVNKKNRKVTILDVGGQPQFRKNRIAYYPDFGAHAIILMFSLSRKRSFNEVEDFRQEIIEFTGSIPLILVGSKFDIWNKEKIPEKDILAYKDKISEEMSIEVTYMPISSKTGKNIKNIFPTIPDIWH